MSLRVATTGPHAAAEPVDPAVITERLRHQLPAKAFEAIQRIRTAAEPERRVAGGARNIIVDIASRLMRRTMRVESMLEAAWAKVMSDEQHTYEIYEQAKHVDFRFKTLSGAVMHVEETIDLFVIAQSPHDEAEAALSLTFASCMREDELKTLAQAYPWRYVEHGDGWRDEALSWYCAQYLKATHVIWTDGVAIDIVLKNIEYTQSYRTRAHVVDPSVRAAVIAAVGEFPGLTAYDLYRRVPQCRADDLHQLIVNGDGVFCDELNELISQHWKLHLYPAAIMVRTVGRLPHPEPLESSVLDLREGGQFQIGESLWTVMTDLGDRLLCKDAGGKLHALDRASLLEQFAKKGVIKAAPRAPASALREVGVLEGKAEERFLRLCELQVRVNRGERPTLTRGEEEALQRYADLVRRGQDGRFAFIAGWQRSGRWGRRIDADEVTLVKSVLGREQLRSGAKGLGAAYAVYVTEFATAELFTSEQQMRATRSRAPKATIATPMSYRSFATLAGSLHTEVEVEEAQRGHKAANAAQLRRPVGGGTGVVGRGFTSQALYPWDKAYLDTNEVDVWTKDPLTGEKARLRTTAMRDGATGLVLAEVSEPHDPNEETYLEVFRECVATHSRFPRRLAIDNAKLHGGSLVVSFCATMLCERELGPRGHGRFRSEIETVFHTLNAWAHYIEGTSEPAKDVRALSPSHRPEEMAIWPPGRFEDEVIKRLFYERINKRVDPKDGLSAQERYDRRMITDGARDNDTITFDANFLILSAPPVKTVGRHAGKLLVGRQGVRGERGEHFTCEALTRPHVVGTYVEGKREPWDISIRHVKVDGQWHPAISEALAEVFQGRSPREIKIISREMRARIGQAPDLAELGRYIADIRRSESELRTAEKRERLLQPLRAALPAATTSNPGSALEALADVDPSVVAALEKAPSEEDAA
jgi:hypothetical protein